MQDRRTGGSGRSATIVTTAIVLGSISFLLGFLLPVALSDSNLGPLLGIFVTGPVGLLLGILVGIILSARRQRPRAIDVELGWLGAAWSLALLFTLASSLVGIGWISVAVQLAVVACAAILFHDGSVQRPAWLRRWRLLILAGGVLALAASVYPPLDSADGGGLRFGFFLDERFDARTDVPEFTVDQRMLIVEWLVIVAAVLVAVTTDRARRKAERS